LMVAIKMIGAAVRAKTPGSQPLRNMLLSE
jgi:hypothetical protein